MRDGMAKRAAFTLVLCGVLVILAVSSAVSLSMMYILSVQDSHSVPTKEQVTKHMKKEAFGHTAIYYTAEEKPFLPLTENTLDYAKRINQIIVGYKGAAPLDLVFFPNESKIEQYSGLKNVVGFYSEQEQMIGLLPEEKKQLLKKDEMAVFMYKQLIIHEYTHFAFHQKTRQMGTDTAEFPLWFHEGLSEWVAHYDLIIDPITFSVVPFDELTTDRDWQKSRSAYETDVYLQSFYMIKDLTDTFGEGIILKIMKKTAEEQNFEKGFREAAKESLTQFEHDFTKAYGKKKTALGTSLPAAVFFLVKALLSHVSFDRGHLRLPLSRCKRIEHRLHILRIQLRDLIIAVFILI